MSISEDEPESATRRRPFLKADRTTGNMDSRNIALLERSSSSLSTSLDGAHVSPRIPSRSERLIIDEDYVMDELEIDGHAKRDE